MEKNNILNNDEIKNRNRLAVLNLLKSRGAMSRSELTKLLACDGTTVTNITRSLTQDGFIKSLGAAVHSGRGRPKELIGLNENACFAAGVSFSPRLLCGTLVDFSGKVIFQEKVYLEKNVSKTDFIERFLKIIENLLSQVPPEKILGLGLATFGIYVPEQKTITRAEYLDAACDINFEELINEKFNIKPEIMDGTTARGIAEAWHRSETDNTSFILLNADVGLGCFIFTNSKPLKTDKCAYNEFGHMIVNPDGPKCEMGHHGCLEAYASIPAIEKHLCEELQINEIEFSEVLNRYKQNDPTTVKTVNASAKWLGIAAVNMINLFAPGEIILSGNIANFGQNYLDVMLSTAQKYALPEFITRTTFRLSTIKEEGHALGAALSLLSSFFNKE